MNLSQFEYNRQLAISGNFLTFQSNIIPFQLENYYASKVSQYESIHTHYTSMFGTYYDFEKSPDFFVSLVWSNKCLAYIVRHDNRIFEPVVQKDCLGYNLEILLLEYAVIHWPITNKTYSILNNIKSVHNAQSLGFVR